MSIPPLTPPGKAQFTLADRQQLPGLLPEETLIFKAWWALHANEYENPDFNVRVGKGFDPGVAFDVAARESAIASTKKRMDALVWKGNQPYIIEVKVRLQPTVIGQVLCYKLLWMQDNPGSIEPKLLILYCRTDVDTLYCAARLEIPAEMVYCDLSQIKIRKG
jgi:hypothetical protein